MQKKQRGFSYIWPSKNLFLSEQKIDTVLVIRRFATLTDWHTHSLECSGFQRGQPLADGVFSKLSYAVDVQPVHNVATVCLDSLGAYMQL